MYLVGTYFNRCESRIKDRKQNNGMEQKEELEFDCVS